MISKLLHEDGQLFVVIENNPETVIMVGDTLVVLGEYEIIKELEKEV